VIDNDIPRGTVGHWAVDVESGGETEDAQLTVDQLGDPVTRNVIFEYLTYVDVGNDGGAKRLIGSEATYEDAADAVASEGIFPGFGGNEIAWRVVSSIADGGRVMRSAFTFKALTGTLGTVRLFQYMDEDLLIDGEGGFGNDVFFTRGSVEGNSLELFTVDDVVPIGVSHTGGMSRASGLANAAFAGWAAGVFNGIAPAIQGAGQPLSLAGVVAENLPPYEHDTVGRAFGPADIVSVLGWDVDPSATTATIITTLGGLPDVEAVQCGNGMIEGDEQCDPRSPDPGDCCAEDCRLETAGTSCRDAGGVCDVAEVCNGMSAVCPTDAKKTGVCRPSADACDVAESCAGGNDCPSDAFAPPTTVCRAAAAVCDVADLCSGSGPSCPADAKSTAPCRPSAGPCDVAEACGGGDDCPADGFAAASMVCRPVGGVCDVAETCSGTAAACPPDGRSAAVCRPASRACDVAESCDGVALTCPPDGRAIDGTACDDRLACTADDACQAGVCHGREDCAEGRSCDPTSGACTPVGSCLDDASCEDGNPCTEDRCVAGLGCRSDTVADGETCDDGDGCTAGPTCDAGVCGVPNCEVVATQAESPDGVPAPQVDLTCAAITESLALPPGAAGTCKAAVFLEEGLQASTDAAIPVAMTSAAVPKGGTARISKTVTKRLTPKNGRRVVLALKLVVSRQVVEIGQRALPVVGCGWDRSWSKKPHVAVARSVPLTPVAGL
jgi:cysteine-rich repeat protein